MKRSAMAILFATFVGLAAAGPATAVGPVTATGTVPCSGIGPQFGPTAACAADSYEVRCTQKAQRLSIRLESEGTPYMAAVITSPASMAGQGQRARISLADTSGETRTFHAPTSVGSLMSALVVVLGSNTSSHELQYQLTASCYSYNGNAENEPYDPDGPFNLDDDAPRRRTSCASP